MNEHEFTDYLHAATHELIALNETCFAEHGISTYERWDYALEQGTLTFSTGGIAKIIASIQVVGSTSKSGGTWMWAWANRSIPGNVDRAATAVRQFGIGEGIPILTNPTSPDTEHLGWEMTAVTAKHVGAYGGYRCPGDNGFLYVILTSIRHADEAAVPQGRSAIQCNSHGQAISTFICQHLFDEPGQKWFPSEPSKTDPWPDSWCAACNKLFEPEGEWNDRNSPSLKAKVVCHLCHERLRASSRL
jgi:hypothetical protein